MTTATLHDRTTQDKADILAVIEGLKKAHHEKKAETIAAAYVADAAIFNLAPPLLHRGIDVAEKQAWLGSWEGPVEIEPREFDVTIAGDFAFCHGYMRLNGKKKGVEQPIRFWMRETLCLERSGDGWRIVHEHTSVPFYMDGSLRPAFDLKP